MIATCSNRVIKYIMFGFNFIFVITGIIILSVGASVKAYFYPYETFLDDQFFSLPNMLIATGALIFFISFLGCYGAMRESWVMLTAFSVLLSIIFIFELSVGIAGYVLRDRTLDYVENTLSGNMVSYKTQSAISSMWDVIQEEFECCGVHDYNDWQIPLNGSSLPLSCCPRSSGIIGAFYCNSYTQSVTTTTQAVITPEPTTEVVDTTVVTKAPTEISNDTTLEIKTTPVESNPTEAPPNNPPNVLSEQIGNKLNVYEGDNPYPNSSSAPYSVGCLSLFGNFIKQHAVDIGAVGISLAIIQLIGICLSFYMARQLKNGYYST